MGRRCDAVKYRRVQRKQEAVGSGSSSPTSHRRRGIEYLEDALRVGSEHPLRHGHPRLHHECARGGCYRSLLEGDREILERREQAHRVRELSVGRRRDEERAERFEDHCCRLLITHLVACMHTATRMRMRTCTHMRTWHLLVYTVLYMPRVGVHVCDSRPTPGHTHLVIDSLGVSDTDEAEATQPCVCAARTVAGLGHLEAKPPGSSKLGCAGDLHQVQMRG